jgi:hypothetical protein
MACQKTNGITLVKKYYCNKFQNNSKLHGSVKKSSFMKNLSGRTDQNFDAFGIHVFYRQYPELSESILTFSKPLCLTSVLI